ncbi:MAG: hypothetical protein RLY57_332 [Candidatus Parcubacteria bacterium]|jgi:hypothetical protein
MKRNHTKGACASTRQQTLMKALLALALLLMIGFPSAHAADKPIEKKDTNTSKIAAPMKTETLKATPAGSEKDISTLYSVAKKVHLGTDATADIGFEKFISDTARHIKSSKMPPADLSQLTEGIDWLIEVSKSGKLSPIAEQFFGKADMAVMQVKLLVVREALGKMQMKTAANK